MAADKNDLVLYGGPGEALFIEEIYRSYFDIQSLLNPHYQKGLTNNTVVYKIITKCFVETSFDGSLSDTATVAVKL